MDEISAFLNTNFIYSQQLLETIISKLNVTQPQIEEATNNSNNASTYYTALITPPVIPPIVNPYSYINFINIPKQINTSLFCAKQQCTSGITKQQGNISKKMLQSKLIKYNGKYNVKYSNSKTDTINRIIMSENHEENKNLVLTLSYSVYIRYFQGIVNKNKNLNIMLNNVLADLTVDQYIKTFCIIPPKINIKILPPIIVAKTYYVITRHVASTKYFIFKNYSDDEPFVPSYSYIFNLEDPSNLNTQLSFSENKNSISYLNMTLVGIAGTSGATAMITIPQDISIDTIYPFNILSLDPYQTYNTWGYTYNGIHIQLNVVAPQKIANACNGHTKSSIQPITPLSYLPDINKTYELLCLNSSSLLSVYELNGPRINIIDVNDFNFNMFYSNNKYGLYIGTYYLYIPRIYAIALLNADQINNIQYTGDFDKMSIDTVLGTTSDGTYNFYYGTITITVTGSFQPISLYTRDYGYMHGKNLIVYSDTCSNVDFVTPYIIPT